FQIWTGVDYTASTASILNLFILSLDRYWSVRQPLKYLHKRTKRRALSMIAFVWTVSCLWVLPISSWHHFAHGGERTVPEDVCDTEYAKNSLFKLIAAFFNFYLPLTIMYILYFRIFIAIRRRSEFELGQRNPGGTVLSYKSNVANSHSLEDSECNDENSSLDNRGGNVSVNHSNSNASNLSAGNGARARQNGTRSLPSGKRNLRLLTVKRQPGGMTYNRDSSGSGGTFKVEYIYDESVLDPQTEKIERYFYEDHYPVQCLTRSTWVVGGDKYSSSLPRTSSGARSNPRPLPDFKMSVKLQANSSTPNLKLSPVTTPQESASQLQITVPVPPQLSKGKGAAFKRGLFKRGKKSSSSSSSKLQGVRLDSYRKYNPEETSFSPSSFPQLTAVSESSSSSASTFEERDRKTTCSGKNKPETTTVINHSARSQLPKHSPRETFSVVSGIRKIRQAESFFDRTAGVSIPPSSSAECCSSKNGEESDGGVMVLHDDKHRRLTGGVTGLKERLRTIRQSSSLNKEIKAARQLGVIMGAFTLCFLPYFTLFLVVAFCDNCVDSGHLTAATWVGYLNSTLNPFLYPLCNANFRTKFRSMLGCCSKRRGRLRSTKQERSERNTAFHSRYD
ncbi:muscarinic acetylcholine receptor M3, partial [Aplysia californica]|uniref:Muscarinic acetylcholine receptor M3 n=1 Tax=Aplysia californica TaxID=6500 RepID=A0ABM0ZYP9_APLCA